MTTREAFRKLLEKEKAVELASKVGLSASRLRGLLSDILNHDQYPSTDLMIQILKDSKKFEIIQPIKWGEKK